MIDNKQLREYVIRPVLKTLKLESPAAENLLVMIAAHESKMGTYLKQVSGPARGIYQMEPATADDLHYNYLGRRPDLSHKVEAFSTLGSRTDDLTANLLYQTAMARVHLARFEEPLPAADDLLGLASYAKKYWNTYAGSATTDDYYKAYKPHHTT